MTDKTLRALLHRYRGNPPSKKQPFEKLELNLIELGFRKELRRDFTRGKQRVNAIDLAVKLPATYTMADLKRIVDHK